MHVKQQPLSQLAGLEKVGRGTGGVEGQQGGGIEGRSSTARKTEKTKCWTIVWGFKGALQAVKTGDGKPAVVTQAQAGKQVERQAAASHNATEARVQRLGSGG